VRRWSDLLHEALSGHSGVWIEDKQFSLAVHYRQSRNKRIVRAAIRNAAASLAGARIVGGKQVVNIVPEDAPHKGIALQKVRARLGCDTAIYVGDDDTDEDVFALDQPGDLLSVRVGAKRSSAARFYLRGQSEMDRFLRVLVGLRRSDGRRAVVRPARASALPPPNSEAIDDRPSSALGQVLDFMRLLWAVDHSLQRTSKRMARDLGLTGPQRFVIRIVGRFPSIPAGRLAALLHLHPSTLTGILVRLQAARLVARRRDARDRRRALLGLTAAGRALDVSLAGTVEDAVQRTLSAVSPGELTATSRVLTVLRDKLDASRGPVSTPPSWRGVRR
jgi:DNA-binding MarR family transcriptional regulator